ncbi:hypothetical protein [Nocardia sp. NPDC050435]|uniref:hypothetical protein n=1 Tax=Nocardia sp. NPDC050435 TaxID=3155040 RepID=UPI0033E51C8A
MAMLDSPSAPARAVVTAAPHPAPGWRPGDRQRAARLDSLRTAAQDATAVAPDPARRAPIWHIPVPHERTPPPLVWLLGAHGGAGVSTLAQLMAPAADCHRRWPAVLEGESPYVVVVARETVDGLARAHDLLRQWHCGQAGHRAHLLGLVTCAHQPKTAPKPITRYLEVIETLAPARWRIGWQADWPITQLEDLPTWTPDHVAPSKGPDPMGAVRELGDALIAAVRAIEYGPQPAPTSKGTLR